MLFFVTFLLIPSNCFYFPKVKLRNFASLRKAKILPISPGSFKYHFADKPSTKIFCGKPLMSRGVPVFGPLHSFVLPVRGVANAQGLRPKGEQYRLFRAYLPRPTNC